jgi:UDP-N-acetylglucosamine acyltransferase
MIVEGNPGRCPGPNSVGLRRAGHDADARRRINTLYKIMFRSDRNTTQALHEIEATVEESDERNHFVDFVRKSIRGITK